MIFRSCGARRALFQAQGTVRLRSYWARLADITLCTTSAALAVVRGIEVWVWLKGEVYERGAIRARLFSNVGIEKRVRQAGQHEGIPLVFFLVRLPSPTTRLGIVGELL